MNTEAIRLAEAAAAWNDVRLEANRLKAERDALRCEFAEPGDEGSHPAESQGPSDPCWKSWDDRDADESFHGLPSRTRMDESEWCASCLKREEIHLMLKPVNALKGVRLRSLQHYAGKYRQDPTYVICSRFLAGESVEALSAALRVDRIEIEAAIRRGTR